MLSTNELLACFHDAKVLKADARLALESPAVKRRRPDAPFRPGLRVKQLECEGAHERRARAQWVEERAVFTMAE